MPNNTQKWIAIVLLFVTTACMNATARQLATTDGNKMISEANCTVDKVGIAIPVSAIGEPVSGVAPNPPRWVAASGSMPAYCAVDGSMAPVDRAPSAKPILFRVALPASWNRRAAQMGGGGTNGVIPNLTGEPFQRGFAAYGSDSGHQNPPPGPRGAAPNPAAADWWFNDEAVRNFGYVAVPGVAAGLLRDLNANPLDFADSEAMTRRRRELSEILDSSNPDLTAFQRRQGKMIVVIGTNDTLASPGAQLDYYQSVIDKMGQSVVDQFARFFVIPQAGHGLTGVNYSIDGDGKTIPSVPVPNSFNRLSVLTDWVEKKITPAKFLTVTAGEKSLPLCSYPTYPKYVSGPSGASSSYVCASN
jgi:hypothetical protein